MASNIERAREYQRRIVLLRKYLGTREEVVKLWGLNDTNQLDQIERTNLKTLIRMAEYADRLGVDIHFDVKLPKG